MTDTDREKEYGEMPAEELEQRLRETFFYPDRIDDGIFRELEALREVLEKKKPMEYTHTARESWARFAADHGEELAGLDAPNAPSGFEDIVGEADDAGNVPETEADEKQTSDEAAASAVKPLPYVPYELGGPLRVQVCHNGFPFNKHYEVLNYLAPLCQGKDRNRIKLFLPLSYGNGALANGVTYVDALKSFIKQKFAENVAIISRMMPNNEYTEYLSSIDVAIFNAPRHNALGNILQLLYMGKKVYLSNKSPLLPYLRGKGFIIHTVDELDGISLEELARPDDTQKNREWIRMAFGVETMRDLWRTIFAYSEGKISHSTAWKKDEEIMRGLDKTGET